MGNKKYSGYIYQISSKDISDPHIYIGSTKNFYLRSKKHREICIYKRNIKKRCKVHKYINCHGGWNCFEIKIIRKCSECKDINELRMCERYYYDILQPTLNSNIPKLTTNEKIIINNKYLQIKNNLLNNYIKIWKYNLK
jgi:hypothetical protein